MKKIIKTILMLTCVFMLTACGSSEAISEHQQNKINQAQSRASGIVQLMTLLTSTEDVDVLLADYDNIELGILFSSAYIQYSGDNSYECEGKAVRSAFTSFQSGLETMGSIEPGTPTSVVDGDNIIVTVPVTGGNASGSVELIFTNDIFVKMTSCTLNLNQTMGQLMTRAALNTLLGMGTVFSVLILISIIIAAFNLIPKIQASFTKKVEPVNIPAPASAPAPAPVVVEEEDLTDDMELVAVIAAAVAAYEGTSVEGFQVRSIKRADTKNWKKSR